MCSALLCHVKRRKPLVYIQIENCKTTTQKENGKEKREKKQNKNKRLTPTDVLDSPVALSFAFSRSVGLFSISCTSSFPSLLQEKRKITKRRAHQAAAAVVFVFFFSLFFFGIFFHFLTPPLDGGGLSEDVCVFERRVFFFFLSHSKRHRLLGRFVTITPTTEKSHSDNELCFAHSFKTWKPPMERLSIDT